MPPPIEKQGFKFYQDVLGSPKHVLAPMVDASELVRQNYLAIESCLQHLKMFVTFRLGEC